MLQTLEPRIPGHIRKLRLSAKFFISQRFSPILAFCTRLARDRGTLKDSFLLPFVFSNATSYGIGFLQVMLRFESPGTNLCQCIFMFVRRHCLRAAENSSDCRLYGSTKGVPVSAVFSSLAPQQIRCVHWSRKRSPPVRLCDTVLSTKRYIRQCSKRSKIFIVLFPVAGQRRRSMIQLISRQL